MCKNHHHKNDSLSVYEKKYRLADFFDKWWDIYKQKPTHYITPEQYKAVNALRSCRTEALGIDHYACPDCGEITQVYHSCKNRFCPTCSWQDTVKWAERIKHQMLSLSHRHIVITLPHQLNELIKENGKELLNVLLRASSDTFKDWMKHKYHLKPGIISVLHTFGETKEYHCHVHMIVSWGGIDFQTGALTPIEEQFVSYDFLKNKFRIKYEDQLIKMFDDGSLFHHFEDRQSFLRFIKRINAKRWVMHLEPPMEIPTQVVRYIGRYSKRACLSEYKITKMEGRVIAFKYKDYKSKDLNKQAIERVIELDYTDFFPRLLQHVPLKYFRLVRYYGLYATRASIPSEYLYVDDDPKEVSQQDNWEELQVDKTGENPLLCSHCKTRKVYVFTSIKRRHDKETTIFKKHFIKHEKVPNNQVA